MFIFTIYDRVSEKAGNIFTCATLGEAERQFHDALKNAQEGSLFRSHPEDFSLHKLGSFDEKLLEIVDVESVKVAVGKPSPEVTA